MVRFKNLFILDIYNHNTVLCGQGLECLFKLKHLQKIIFRH